MIEKLWAKLELTKSQVIDIWIFQSQAIEIRKRLLVAHQGILVKVEMIQSSFQLIDQILENLFLREREVRAVWVAFQEAIIATMRKEIRNSFSFPMSEQTRGNILLKEWERNISEGRQQAKEIRK